MNVLKRPFCTLFLSSLALASLNAGTGQQDQAPIASHGGGGGGGHGGGGRGGEGRGGEGHYGDYNHHDNNWNHHDNNWNGGFYEGGGIEVNPIISPYDNGGETPDEIYQNEIYEQNAD